MGSEPYRLPAFPRKSPVSLPRSGRGEGVIGAFDSLTRGRGLGDASHAHRPTASGAFLDSVGDLREPSRRGCRRVLPGDPLRELVGAPGIDAFVCLCGGGFRGGRLSFFPAAGLFSQVGAARLLFSSHGVSRPARRLYEWRAGHRFLLALYERSVFLQRAADPRLPPGGNAFSFLSRMAGIEERSSLGLASLLGVGFGS